MATLVHHCLTLAADLVHLRLIAISEVLLRTVTGGNKVPTKKLHFLHYSLVLDSNLSLVLKAEVYILERSSLTLWKLHGI